MLRHLALLAFFGFASIAFGTYVKERQAPAEVVGTAEAQSPVAQPVRLSGVERLPRDAHGHYVGEFRFNNHRVKGLIDTGATTIAINESVARRAGIFLRRDDFIYQVSTANGTVTAARAKINNVQIGQIRIAEVEAMVLPDQALNHVLVGMSFMNRLRGFEYQNGYLVLRR